MVWTIPDSADVGDTQWRLDDFENGPASPVRDGLLDPILQFTSSYPRTLQATWRLGANRLLILILLLETRIGSLLNFYKYAFLLRREGLFPFTFEYDRYGAVNPSIDILVEHLHARGWIQKSPRSHPIPAYDGHPAHLEHFEHYSLSPAARLIAQELSECDEEFTQVIREKMASHGHLFSSLAPENKALLLAEMGGSHRYVQKDHQLLTDLAPSSPRLHEILGPAAVRLNQIAPNVVFRRIAQHGIQNKESMPRLRIAASALRRAIEEGAVETGEIVWLRGYVRQWRKVADGSIRAKIAGLFTPNSLNIDVVFGGEFEIPFSQIRMRELTIVGCVDLRRGFPIVDAIVTVAHENLNPATIDWLISIDGTKPTGARIPSRPTCYIAYAWGTPALEMWTERFAEQLQECGVNVIFDRWENLPGDSLRRFLDNITRSDFVCVVGSHLLLSKYNSPGRSVVREELDEICARLVEPGLRDRIIPILREGESGTAFPPAFSKLIWADFREEANFIRGVDEVYRKIARMGRRDDGEATEAPASS